MESSSHRLCDLFRQLGLPGETPAIDRFIAAHTPIAASIRLEDAPFWSPSQATFLREKIAEDADWAELVDMLDARLRQPSR